MNVPLIVFFVFVLALFSSSLVEILPWSISGLIILSAFTAAYFYHYIKARN